MEQGFHSFSVKKGISLAMEDVEGPTPACYEGHDLGHGGWSCGDSQKRTPTCQGLRLC